MKKEEQVLDPHTQPDAAERQAGMCKIFKASEYWNENWGPRPGEAGCKVPREILEKFGLDDERTCQ
jgi:hypothetical protein